VGWFFNRVLAASVTMGFLLGGSAMAGELPPDLAALDARKVEFMERLAEPVRACVQRQDTSHDLFHGCIDWHSAVHGFWALTAAARITGRKDLAKFVQDSLTSNGIALEQRYMNERPGFEMPYGRAWFLRLAVEFEQAFGDRRLRAMADDMAGSLADALKSETFDPNSSSYDSQSWSLINLRAYAVQTGKPDMIAFVDDIVEQVFVPIEAPCAANQDAQRRSFMAVCTNWAWLVSETMDGQAFATWLARFLPDPAALKPVADPANAHLYGLNFSRAWGLWRLYRRSGDARYLKLYRAHLEPTFDRPTWWRGDYQVVGHWVSQFGMFAIMPLFEPDYF